MRTRIVLRELQKARAIHVAWVAYLREDATAGARLVSLEEAVGGAEWHDHWVEVYDVALRIVGSARYWND